MAGEQIGIAQLVENDTLFIDTLTYAEQTTDISYGRYPDGSANWNFFDNPTPLDSNRIGTAIEYPETLPLQFSLSQNYPNPLNPKTTIEYQISLSGGIRGGFPFVQLEIFNILGQKVATLVSEKQPAGRYKVEWDATKFASGVYIYKLSTDQGYTKAKKLILLK